MAIESIEILNVMGFRRQWRKNNDDCDNTSIEGNEVITDGFELKFCDGINVLIGANGVGKTTILKMIYAAAQCSIASTDPGKVKRFMQFFSNSLKDNEALKNADRRDEVCYYQVSDGTHRFEDNLSSNSIYYKGWLGLNIQSAYNMEDIKQNHIMMADNRLLDEVYEL